MQCNMGSTRKYFKAIYARNCELRLIDQALADSFLSKNHLLFSTNARYHYGLFLIREDKSEIALGTLVAVATFSSARKWHKSSGLIKSYEWLRYASLSEYRVQGAMSKFLSYFIKSVRPDDIMTYVDLSAYDGYSYKSLGFKEEGIKSFGNGGKSLKLRLKLTDWD